MCNAISFSSITSVKVIGAPIGGRRDPSKPLIDADNDGKCQEENGKWIPCPPGIGTGSVIDGAGRVIGRVAQQSDGGKYPEWIAERRKRYKEKAAKIIEAAKRVVPKSKQDKYKRQNLKKISAQLDNWIAQYEKKFPRPKEPEKIAGLSPDQRDAAILRHSQALAIYREDMMTALYEENEKLTKEIIGWAAGMFTHDFTDRSGNEIETTVNIARIDPAAVPPRVIIVGSIDEYGLSIGTFNRTLHMDGSVTHNNLDIDEDRQKDGIGSAFNAAVELLYRNTGFKKINTSGLSDDEHIGATHWPKNGFDWRDERSKEQFLDIIESAVDSYERNPLPWMFTSEEHKDRILEALQRARREAMTDKDRITAGDLLDWPGAERFFQLVDLEGTTINYTKVLD